MCVRVCVCVFVCFTLQITIRPTEISKKNLTFPIPSPYTNPVPYIIAPNGHAMNFKTKYLKDGLVGKANVTYRPGTGERNRNSDSPRTGRSGVLSPVRVKIFVFAKPVHTGPWTQPASSTMGTWPPFPGAKWPGRKVGHPPPSSADVKERVQLCLYF